MRCIVCLLTMLFLGVAPVGHAAEDHTEWPTYSVQVRAVPYADRESGMATYRQLRDKGYLVYVYRIDIDGQQWLRIAVGAFRSRGAAAEFGRAFSAAEGLDHFVSQSPMRIVRGARDRDFILTPTALWVRGVDGAREVFVFTPDEPNWPGLAEVLIAELSPDRSMLTFLYDNRIYVASATGAETRALTDGKSPVVSAGGDYRWRPGWSPSGRYVAFLDQAYWEYPIGLWVARADGDGLRCLACDPEGQDAVRWFVWHPSEDRVLFVQGFGFGTVAVGGGLYSADPDGTVTPVAAVTRGEREEIAGPLRIEDGYLHFRRVQHDAEYMDRTIADDRIALDALR